MRVVFGVFSSQFAGGGVSRVAYELALAFSLQGHQVLLVRPGTSNRKIKINKNYSQFWVKSTSEKEIFIPLLTPKTIKAIQKNLDDFKPEIIHSHDPGPICFLLQLWASKNNIPFIFTSHILLTKMVEFGAKETAGKFGKFFDFKLIDEYEKFFLENCDGAIALNKKAEGDLRKFGFLGKIFIIPNGRNLALYNQHPFANIKNFEKRLIFVGHLSQRKNQKYLLKVMKYLPKNYFLDLVGDFLSKKYFEELKNYKRKYHLENVRFLGRIEHDKLPNYLSQSHLFVSASKMEVQSLAVIEALASGTPVVGLGNETIDEFVDDLVGARLPKKTSAEKFAKTVVNILSLPEKDYFNLCQNARQKVAHLDWKQVVSQTVEAYRETIKTKKQAENKRKIPGIFSDLQKIFSLYDWDAEQIKKRFPVFNRKYIYLLLLVSIGQIAGSFLKLAKNIKKIKRRSRNFLNRGILAA